MQDEVLIERLARDFDDAATTFESDGFACRIFSKLQARQRARQGVLGATALAGAGLAALQFDDLLMFSANASFASAIPGESALFLPLATAVLLIGFAAVTTAVVMRHEG